VQELAEKQKISKQAENDKLKEGHFGRKL